MAANPIIIFESLHFYCYIKGPITVPTEHFKYYHATCGDAAQLFFTTRGHPAQRYQTWLLVYNQYTFGICYENMVPI
jgi:hypothetical protein